MSKLKIFTFDDLVFTPHTQWYPEVREPTWNFRMVPTFPLSEEVLGYMETEIPPSKFGSLMRMSQEGGLVERR